MCLTGPCSIGANLTMLCEDRNSLIHVILSFNVRHSSCHTNLLCDQSHTKPQVCKKCHDLFDKGDGLQGDPKDLIPRAPRLSMFSRIPREMQDLTLEERRALRLAGCPTPAKAKGKTVEALLFPWLYPLNTGMYADGTKGANCRSFKDDMEMKLNSADSRWRDDDEWATWAGLKAEGKDGTADLFKPL